LNQIQTTLVNRAVLYHVALEDFSLVWMITQDRIRLEKIDVSYDELQRDNRRISAGSDSSDGLPAIEKLLVPFANQRRAIREWIIIPDNDFLLVPWSYVGKKVLPRISSPVTVTVSSSLTGYFYSFNNRKISGDQIYLSDAAFTPFFSDRDFTVLSPVISKQNNSFPDQIQNLELSDLILLGVETEWRPNEPSHSRMGYIIKTSAPSVFKPLDLYRLSLNATLVHLNFDQAVNNPDNMDAFLAWERAFINAGIPSLLITLWPGDERSDSLFIAIFYEKLEFLSPAIALAETQDHFARQGEPPSFWARFQIYGFGGMSEQEVELYASRGFETKIRRGHSAFDLGEWTDAIRLYGEAYKMASRQKDEISMEHLRQRILESAVNGAVWDTAIETQQQMTTRAEAENDIQGIASGYRNLAYFYTENRQFQEGIEYKQKYTTLTERYGLYEEEANAIRETGLIYERGGNYDKAIEAFQLAGEKYAALKNVKGEALCLQDIGRIHFFYLDDYTLALDYQRKSLPLFESLGNSPEYIVLLQNLALAHERIANYKEALDYLERALRLAGEISDEVLSVRTKQYLANVQDRGSGNI